MLVHSALCAHSFNFRTVAVSGPTSLRLWWPQWLWSYTVGLFVSVSSCGSYKPCDWRLSPSSVARSSPVMCEYFILSWCRLSCWGDVPSLAHPSAGLAGSCLFASVNAAAAVDVIDQWLGIIDFGRVCFSSHVSINRTWKATLKYVFSETSHWM